MSKLAKQVVELLKDGPLTVYQIAERLDRSAASIKTIIFDSRQSGYIETANDRYPSLYALTPKASEPIKIDWKKRNHHAKPVASGTMVERTIRSTPNSVFALGGM